MRNVSLVPQFLRLHGCRQPRCSGMIRRKVYRSARLWPEIDIAGDDDGSLPPGEIGRIHYKHPGTATGYHNDPDASKTAFRGGWYYPGDLDGATLQDTCFSQVARRI